jgi:phage tail-like protein
MPDPPVFPVCFHFKVTFSNGSDDEDNRFQEVSGLAGEVAVEEYREGGLNTFAYRLPTGSKYGNLILKRGYLSGTTLANWCRRAVEEFNFDPRSVDVSLLNEQHQPLAQWSFTRAYPVKWSVSDLKAQDNALAIESLELAYQSFRFVRPAEGAL